MFDVKTCKGHTSGEWVAFQTVEDPKAYFRYTISRNQSLKPIFENNFT